MVALLLLGFIAFRLLPVSALPQIDYPTIQVVTLYPGASPEVTASSITSPLERQFGQMPGLKQMSSTTAGGASVITLQFELELKLDIAEQTVQAAINAARTFLPEDLPVPPVYSKVNPADAPIITLAIQSGTLPLSKVEDLVDTRLAQKISQVTGVGLVTVGGGQRPAVRIQANPKSLSAYGLSLEDLRSALVSANVNLPKGMFDGQLRAAIIDANDQLKSAAEYRSLIISYRNGAPVHLSDVATAVDDAENIRLAAWANQTSAVILNIQRQPGANVIETVERIHQLLPTLKAALPPTVEVVPLTDRTLSIRASIRDVKIEMGFAILLVVIVIFLFLGSPSATLIPAIAVPLSLIGTFAVMYLAGFSINNLTLMALTVATGFVVDDAIVVIENISRYLERGESPLKAALKGSEQIGFTIISLTLSLIAVLIPLLFMEDIIGRLFREFAITLAIAVLISAIISLTLTPMMCSRLLKQDTGANWFHHSTNKIFEQILRLYALLLQKVLKNQSATLMIAATTLVLTCALYLWIPKGFFPAQDTGIIQGISVAPGSISFGEMSKRQQELARLILENSAVESLSSFIGVDGINPTLNTGRFLINLKPKEIRQIDSAKVIQELSQKIEEKSEGVELYLQPVQDLTIENRLSRTRYQFTMETPNPDELGLWARKMADALKARPDFADVATDMEDQGLQAYVKIDRATASRLGVTVSAIDNALYDAFGQRQVSTIFTQSNQYRVIMEVKPEYGNGLSILAELRIPSTNGQQIPLASLAEIKERPMSLVINHLGQFPAATLSFNLSPGSTLGKAVQEIAKAKEEIELPKSVRVDFQGASRAFGASLSNTPWLILAAMISVYIVLGILYESFIHPLTILSTLPSAGVGALLALMMTGTELDIVGIIGIILLMGIVKKNAIMMIDFALEAERKDKKTPYDAIYKACLLRFRPIMMTTLAALFGALPLMLGQGVGSELRHPLGITMVGGLLLSQFLTLFTTPVIYLALDRLGKKWSGTASTEPKTIKDA